MIWTTNHTEMKEDANTPNRYPKALDGNGSVEKNGGFGECQLGNGEERSTPVVGLSCTQR